MQGSNVLFNVTAAGMLADIPSDSRVMGDTESLQSAVILEPRHCCRGVLASPRCASSNKF